MARKRGGVNYKGTVGGLIDYHFDLLIEDDIIYPGKVIPVDDLLSIEAKGFTFEEVQRLMQILTQDEVNMLLQTGSVYDTRTAAEQEQFMQDLTNKVNRYMGKPVPLKWIDIIEVPGTVMDMKDYDPNDDSVRSIQDPIELRISKAAFERCDSQKKEILKQLRKRVAVAQWTDKASPLFPGGIPGLPMTIVWFFEKEEYLRVVTEYPWLLDNNLGEPEPDYTISYQSVIQSAYSQQQAKQAAQANPPSPANPYKPKKRTP